MRPRPWQLFHRWQTLSWPQPWQSKVVAAVAAREAAELAAYDNEDEVSLRDPCSTLVPYLTMRPCTWACT